MSKQFSKILMSLSGEYLVAAQLCGRGYLVSVLPKGMPGADLEVYDVDQDRARLVQVKTFSGRGNKNPLIGVRSTYDNLDEVLRDKIRYPYVFVEMYDDIMKARFYILSPSDVRRLAKEEYLEWLRRPGHRESVEDLKAREQPLAISVSKLRRYENKWDNIWRD